MRHCRFNPGPNQYNPSDIMLKKEPSWRVGSSQRRPLSATSRTPGPGNYNIAGKAGGPKVSRFRSDTVIVCNGN